MKTLSPTQFRLAAALAASLVAAACAGADQPEARQPDAPPEKAPGSPPGSGSGRSRGERDLLRQLMSLPPEERRARLRAYLVERQERADKLRDSLERAIKSLDDGAPLDDLGKLIPAEAREFRGGWTSSPFGPPIDGAAAPTTETASPATINPDELGPVPVPGVTSPSSTRGGPPGTARPEALASKPHEGPITEEQRAVVSEFFASAAPQIMDMYKQFEQKSPERAEARMRETIGRIRWLIDLRKTDRPAYDLRLMDIRHGREAFDAARELVRFDRANPEKSASADRSAITDRMRAALSAQYRVRGELLQRDLTRLEADAAKQRAEFEKRAETRDATIARSMEKLTQRAADFQKRHEHRRRGPEGSPQADRAPSGSP
ncbi:MAG: hypothetical protein IT438_03680 [Phycisphaerales bacterium]|nr:hypothetical protein [Phycisphaerales bacterium]